MSQLAITASVSDAGFTGQLLQADCTPSNIEVGITCGMTGMCGESPCLCGSPDVWGDCACNGLETIYPQISVTSSNSLTAFPVELSDGWHLISFIPGQADINVTAQLKHYDDANTTVHVSAGAPSMCVVAGLLCIIVVIAGIVAAVSRIKRKRKAVSSQAGSNE